MALGQRVLIVDDLADMQEVLQAVLEPRGLQVERWRAERLPATGDQPDLLVIDAEAVPQKGPALFPDAPQVIIGPHFQPRDPSRTEDREYVRKPFQYPELIAAIERLLPGAARSEVHA